MIDLTDLGRKLDRTSYDLARALVKLDEAQQHPAMLPSIVFEMRMRLANVHIVIGQIERLDVLQDVPEAKGV